jgi:hypothetical protein
MSEKACVVVEGMSDATIVRAIVPPELREEVMLAPAGGRSNIASVARTLLVTRRKPVAILVDTDSVEEGIIHDRLQSTQELLKAVAGGIPTKVILLIPTIESALFMAGVLTKLYGAPLPEEVRFLARSDPKKALERLVAEPNRPNNIKALLDRFGAEEIDAMRATPPFQELITFLEGVIKPTFKHAIA